MTRRTLAATALLAALCIAPALAAPPGLVVPSPRSALPSLRVINASGCQITVELLQNNRTRQAYAPIKAGLDWETSFEGEFTIVITAQCNDGNPTASAQTAATLSPGHIRTYSVGVESTTAGRKVLIHFLY